MKRRCDRIGNFDEANTLLRSHSIIVISGELDSVMDKDGVKYTVEKYCYSNPSNMISTDSEGDSRCIMGN